MKKSHANIVLFAYDKFPPRRAGPSRGRIQASATREFHTVAADTLRSEPDQYASNGRLTRAKIIDP